MAQNNTVTLDPRTEKTIAQADEIARLRQANAELQEKLDSQAANRGLSVGVSEKGAMSLYGLQSQFPITLYVEQWEKVFEKVPELKAFIAKHRKAFKVKGDTEYERPSQYDGKANASGVSAKRFLI